MFFEDGISQEILKFVPKSKHKAKITSVVPLSTGMKPHPTDAFKISTYPLIHVSKSRILVNLLYNPFWGEKI